MEQLPGFEDLAAIGKVRVRGKKLYSTGVPHPAVFSDSIIPVLASMLDASHKLVLDPFAGVGKVHQLQDVVSWPIRTVGVEIEPEWAHNHKQTVVGSALALPFRDESVDAIVTSPTYGNRLADSHNARDGSVRRSYTHDLGRTLNGENSGSLQWGERYRQFHERAWTEAFRVIRPGGRLILNVSDHVRNAVRQYVSSWHVQALIAVGFAIADGATVDTARYREGANSDSRLDSEFVFAFDKIVEC